MKGLDASVVRLSNSVLAVAERRLDPGYYGTTALQALAAIAPFEPVTLGSISTVTDGIHSSIDFDEASEVALISAQHPKRGHLPSRAGIERISSRQHLANPRTALRSNDVIVSTVGTIGETAIVRKHDLPANSDRHIGIIRCTDQMQAGLVAAFLLSRYGRSQAIRETTGNVQLNLFIYSIRRLLIPTFSETVCRALDGTMRASSAARFNAERALKRSENHLTRALALPAQAAASLTYVRSAQEARMAGRLDATYFSPAKQSMLDALATLPGASLGERFAAIRSMFNPEVPGEVTQVRDYDLPDALQPVLDDSKTPEPVSAIGSVKKRLANDDVVISRLRAYLKEVAVVRAPEDLPVVGSSEFIVLRRRPEAPDISPETLLAFLRSDPVQTVLKYCQDGSQHPRFSEADLLAIPLPDAVAAASPDITLEVQAAFAARRRARQLLDAAVRAVEIAIEDSEAAALANLEAARS